MSFFLEGRKAVALRTTITLPQSVQWPYGICSLSGSQAIWERVRGLNHALKMARREFVKPGGRPPSLVTPRSGGVRFYVRA